ncbi:N-6 DNA methylase [Bacillus thuringiensis]|nr:N-6 DNA methylase [Bacillus thuringiensis]
MEAIVMLTEFMDNISANSIETIFRRIENINKELNEQYFTPMPIANYMSSSFKPIKKSTIQFMDAGAGIGNLTAAFIAFVCGWKDKPKKIVAELYEIDDTLTPELKRNMDLCQDLCNQNQIVLEVVIKNEDFIESIINDLNNKEKSLDYIILNPPYKKLSTNSRHKDMMLRVGIDVPNYYAAFVSLSYRLLKERAQLVCIIPRSFCNGQYFKSFRSDLISNIKIKKIHLFESRKDLFYDDVLQETLIMHITRENQQLNDNILITTSIKDDFSKMVTFKERFDNIVFPTDNEKIIRIINENDKEIVERMHSLPCKLEDLGINVSTGPVVDFRENEGLLSFDGNLFSNPIIYPENFVNGFVRWPIAGRKPGYLIEDNSNTKRFRPAGIYVVVKRMSSKEEDKRIVASVYNSEQIGQMRVAFDNKLNYYHISNQSLGNMDFAKGLSLFLNSTLVDFYFRTFSGSTQVNVSDLKGLYYPKYSDLELLGQAYQDELPDQEEIYEIMQRILFV